MDRVSPAGTVTVEYLKSGMGGQPYGPVQRLPWVSNPPIPVFHPKRKVEYRQLLTSDPKR